MDNKSIKKFILIHGRLFSQLGFDKFEIRVEIWYANEYKLVIYKDASFQILLKIVDFSYAFFLSFRYFELMQEQTKSKFPM